MKSENESDKFSKLIETNMLTIVGTLEVTIITTAKEGMTNHNLTETSLVRRPIETISDNGIACALIISGIIGIRNEFLRYISKVK